MPSTRRSWGSGRHVCAHLALLLGPCVAVTAFSLTVLGGDPVHANPPFPPHGDGVHPGGGNGGLDDSSHGYYPPANPPPPTPTADVPPPPPPDNSAPPASPLSGVAGASASGHASH